MLYIITIMEIDIKVNGKIILGQDMVFIILIMVQNLKENGKMVLEMALERYLIKM